MRHETYLSELTAQLERRGVPENQICEIIAEVENHLAESGEQPEDSFGPAAEYAEKIAISTESKKALEADQQPNGHWHYRTFRATGFDEMGILKLAGKEGWELVDVGAYALFCRRPVNLPQAPRWEYKRRTGCRHRIITEEMLAGNWEPCGNWIAFHYFKRKLEQ